MRILQILTLAFAVVAVSGCRQYAISKPITGDLLGSYVPQDYKEANIKRTSRIVLKAPDVCTLVDFPVVTYRGNNDSKVDYFNGQGSWSLDNSTGNWKLNVTPQTGDSFTLRICLTTRAVFQDGPPYILCQEGEDLDYDALLFVHQSGNVGANP